MPSTRSSAKAVKISRSRVRAMWRNTGRARKWPSTSVPTTTAAAKPTPCQEKPDQPPDAPRSGSTASIGITARSWKSRMAKVACPPCVLSAAALGERLQRERGGGERKRHAADDGDAQVDAEA